MVIKVYSKVLSGHVDYSLVIRYSEGSGSRLFLGLTGRESEGIIERGETSYHVRHQYRLC